MCAQKRSGVGKSGTPSPMMTVAPGPADGHGFLRVTTEPAVRSRISVDGQWANDWGLDWLKIAPGFHWVCFSGVPETTGPDCHPVDVAAGQTTVVVGTFEQHGILRVLTQPPTPATVFVDGFPANAWGVFTSLRPGQHQVCGGRVEGLITPPCQLIDLEAGAVEVVDLVYASP